MASCERIEIGMQRGRLTMALTVPVLALSVLAGCGSSSKSSPSTTTFSSAVTTPTTTIAAGNTVHVTVSDTKGLGGPMTLVAAPASVQAGDVTFVVKNTGTIDHEVIVLKTSVPFNNLPITDGGDPPAPVTSGANKVSETNKSGETGDPNLKPGVTRSFTIKNMAAGTYALVCNIAQHYQKGMRAAFTVT
jgi:uncharacterized cupredoxin-like copper-binding protein